MYLSSVTVTVSPRADVHVQFRDMVKHDRHSVDSIPRAISKKMHAFVLRLFLTPDPGRQDKVEDADGSAPHWLAGVSRQREPLILLKTGASRN